MILSERMPIHEQFVRFSTITTLRHIAASLEQQQAACIQTGEAIFLLTPDDLPLLALGEDMAAGLFLTERPALASPVLSFADAATSHTLLDRLPVSLSRPVVLTQDGAVCGYLPVPALLAFAVREQQRYASYFHALAQTVTDAVTVVDSNGSVICWNRAAEEIYGIPQEDILGRRIGEHFDPEDLVVMKILDEGRTIRNAYHRPRPGTHVLINASPVLDPRGGIIGGIATEQDITNLVRLNNELASVHTGRLEVKPDSPDPFSALAGSGGGSIGKAIQLAGKVSGTDTPLLLIGESGVGKEQLAHMIHRAGPRARQPFLVVNCGAIPPGLLDAELFGYQGGAFTGNEHGQSGKLELADGGTLFLDEIDRLPLDIQAKLYHYLKSGAMLRSGGSAPIAANTRVIAATSRDLAALVKRHAFRPDLYFAINVVPISLPPLRERKEDLPGIVQLFLREFALQYQKPIPEAEPEVMLALANYHWPGNMRELRNIIERCMILSDDDHITLEHLPEFLRQGQPSLNDSTEAIPKPEKMLGTRLSDHEELRLIEEALAKTYGNKSAAAKLLKVSRGTLYNKMREYNIHS